MCILTLILNGDPSQTPFLALSAPFLARNRRSLSRQNVLYFRFFFIFKIFSRFRAELFRAAHNTNFFSRFSAARRSAALKRAARRCLLSTCQGPEYCVNFEVYAD